MGRAKRKRVFDKCLSTCIASDFYRVCTKLYSGICSPLIHFVLSNDFVSNKGPDNKGPIRLDVKSDLRLRCPHMPQRHVLLRAVQINMHINVSN